MPTLLSLYDYSGRWSQPYAENGWNVIRWDKKLDADNYSTFSDIEDACAEFIYDNIFENYGTVEGVLAAPPCTELALSGAQYWPIKDKDGRTEQALEYVDMVVRIVDLCKPYFWAMENPVGRLPKLRPEYGKPWYFQPHWFGDAYTKKTGLWGNFQKPVRTHFIEPKRFCKQGSWTQKLGGKSEKTKELRSMTPLGFSYAFYQANNNFDHIEDLDTFFDMYEVFPSGECTQLTLFKNVS